jgi:endonuclease G
MTNILPQSALMNRGAWLKTEMMVECWRNEVPITVIGGAVYMGDGSHGQSMPDEWGGHDRSDWFMESHNVKNPAFQWKVIITGAHGAYTDEDHIAFWMPNHESAKAANVNDYIISVDDLNAKLAAWGVPENIVLEHSATQYGEVWPDPAGCNRA